MNTIIKFILNLMARPDPFTPVDDTPMVESTKPLYNPSLLNIEAPEDTEPQVCHMNEGDMLCIHRSHSTDSILLHAGKLGYELTGDDRERCDYMPDHDHYPVVAV